MFGFRSVPYALNSSQIFFRQSKILQRSFYSDVFSGHRDTQLKGLRGHICYNKAIFKKSKSEISQLGDRKLIVRFSNLLSFILSSVLGYLTFQLRSYLESLENCLGRQNMTEQLLCWS